MVEQFQNERSQSLGRWVYISSMLAARTIAGTDEAKPEKKRPMKTPMGEETRPTSRDEIQDTLSDKR